MITEKMLDENPYLILTEQEDELIPYALSIEPRLLKFFPYYKDYEEVMLKIPALEWELLDDIPIYIFQKYALEHPQLLNCKRVRELDILRVLSKHPEAIEYISFPTVKMQSLVINQSVGNIIFIHNPDTEIQLKVVRKKPSLIKYINSPSKEVKDFIIRNAIDYISFIQPLSIDEMKLAISINPELFYIFDIFDKELQLAAVRYDYKIIKDIINPSVNIQIEAVSQSNDAILYIKSPDPRTIKLLK